VILIAAGVIFLLRNFNILSGDVGSTLIQLWPLLFILIGLDSLLQGHGLAGPVFLIGLGVVFLLNNFGRLPWNSWELILRLWPVLIIAIGLDIMIGRRSAWGSLIALILMLAILAGALLLIGVGNPGVDHPFTWNASPTITHIDATLNPAVGSLRVSSLSGSNSLAEGVLHLQKGENTSPQMQSDGTFSIKSENVLFMAPLGKATRWKWDVNFAPKVPINFNVNMGVGEMDLDLTLLTVNQLNISLGVGKITILLPPMAMNGKINSAIGETVLTIPRGAEVQIKVSSGITSVNMPPGYTHNGDLYTSPGYNNSGSIRINLDMSQAIGQLKIVNGK
jgi:hypothetical protein